jgi:large repetitive protein
MYAGERTHLHQHAHTWRPAEAGWNYLKLNDPGNGNFDHRERDAAGWAGHPPGQRVAHLRHPAAEASQPVYEDKFHFVDKLATTAPTSYTVVWAA